MKENTHEIHLVNSDDLLMYAIIPNDGTRGYLMGERWEVEQIRDKLNALLQNNEYDGEVSSDFEQLGYKWLTVPEAAQLIFEVHGEEIPTRTIRYACKNGHIKNAEMQGRDWRFPQVRFLAWVNNRPKPGRKTLPSGFALSKATSCCSTSQRRMRSAPLMRPLTRDGD